jgi:hypothetical protein
MNCLKRGSKWLYGAFPGYDDILLNSDADGMKEFLKEIIIILPICIAPTIICFAIKYL